MRPWEPEFPVSAELARGLIAEQFPDLAEETIEHMGTGWDNVAYLVGARFVFRFPQRTVAVGLMEREMRVLPLLAPHLPLAVPMPIYPGRPVDQYPYPFAGYALIRGVTACVPTWTDAARERSAAPLGKFLSALHRLPTPPSEPGTFSDGTAWPPADDIGRSNSERRLQLAKGSAANMPDVNTASAIGEMERLGSTPGWIGEPVWTHGDLYARHLVVDENLIVCGVIDWGDAHLGDPALDIAIAFSFLPPAARQAFRESYGEIDENTWERARFRALFYGVTLTDYARQIEDGAMLSLSAFAMRNALQ